MKTKQCSTFLQILDNDYTYCEAKKEIKKVYPTVNITELEKELTKYILFSAFIGVFGLALNNFLSRITFRNNLIYWIEIGLLGLYVTLLFVFYKKHKTNS